MYGVATPPWITGIIHAVRAVGGVPRSHQNCHASPSSFVAVESSVGRHLLSRPVRVPPCFAHGGARQLRPALLKGAPGSAVGATGHAPIHTTIVASRDERPLSRVPIDVGSMVDAMDPDRLRLVVDAVEEPVGSAASTVVAGELAPEWFAHAPGFACQVAEGEFDDRCQDSRWKFVEVTLAGGRESSRVAGVGFGHSAWPPRDLVLVSDLVFAISSAGDDIGLGLSHRLRQARLR